MNFGAPLGELLGHFDQIFAFGVRVAAGNTRVHLGRSHDHRRTVAVGVVQRAYGIAGTRQGAHLRDRRPAGDPRVSIRHGHDASLVQREDETDFFLIGDGADKFLTAGARQTENVIHPMGYRHFEIGLRSGFRICTIISHREFLLRLFVQGSTVQRLNRSSIATLQMSFRDLEP